MKRSNAIWVAWEWHRRTSSLTQRMDIPLYIFTSKAPGLLRLPILITRTILILLLRRPRILFVQNPSAFLTIVSIFLKPVFRYSLVVDAHNAGVYPFERGHEKYQRVFPFMHRHADKTIVTNLFLSDIISGHGGNPYILPDILPSLISANSPNPKSDKFMVTFICSYASDEPYMEVIKAAHSLPDYIQVNITGNYKKLSATELTQVGKNVNLTGFLGEQEYVTLLKTSDVIMDLTTFDDCLVCGAYEAVSLDIPLILSDTPALRWWFNKGVVYTQNSTESISLAILQAEARRSELVNEITALKTEINDRWEKLFGFFLADNTKQT